MRISEVTMIISCYCSKFRIVGLELNKMPIPNDHENMSVLEPRDDSHKLNKLNAAKGFERTSENELANVPEGSREY